jgi:hypothetical protein
MKGKETYFETLFSPFHRLPLTVLILPSLPSLLPPFYPCHKERNEDKGKREVEGKGWQGGKDKEGKRKSMKGRE